MSGSRLCLLSVRGRCPLQPGQVYSDRGRWMVARPPRLGVAIRGVGAARRVVLSVEVAAEAAAGTVGVAGAGASDWLLALG